MSQSLYKRYFELVPINNITTFAVNSGTNQISFLIPPVQGAALQTSDMCFSGTLTVKKDDGTSYTSADFGTTDISFDSVNGAHNLISRVDILSQGSGNALIEQRRQYALINKYRRGTLSKNDLAAGKHNIQGLCSTNSNGARNFLSSTGTAATGHDFAIQLNTGFLMDNVQQLNLGAANGLIVKIYLNEVSNALFSIDPSAASKLTSDFNIELTNVKLFGRYNFVTQPVLSSLSGVQFRKINDLISVVQSANDTIANSPMVNSLHKIVHIYQPNNTTANNVDANNTQTNQIVGLKKYAISNNGSRHPYNYDIDITPSIDELPSSAGEQGRVSGNAEQIYFFLNALNGQYPPVHSLVNASNQAKAHEDLLNNENNETLNVNGIAVDYSYGFKGFSVPMTNNLLQINVESSVLTNDAIVVPASRDQTQTQNSFCEYDSMLTYQGMGVVQ
jgi:hypothetical protein